MAFRMNDFNWIIEPKYDEIIVYGEKSFVAKEGKIYKILDYNEKSLFEFTDNEIIGISDHPNEGGELQEIINVNYWGSKSRLFNIKSLNFLHEDKYYLLQTEGYYEPERRLIRVFDELKEGVMDFDGNMILPPIYEGVSVSEEYRLGFKSNEIDVFYANGKLDKVIPYINLRPRHFSKRKVIKIHRKTGELSNIYKEVRKNTEGIISTEYKQLNYPSISCGIVNIQHKIVIPFEYSSLSIINENFIEFTKKEHITEKGVPINYFNPKYGIIDFNNNIILPNEYKNIGVVQGGIVEVENFEHKRAIFNLKTKKFETDFIYENYSDSAKKISELDESNKYLKFTKNNLVGMKDKSGNILIPAKYRDYGSTSNPEIYIVYGASEDKYGYQGYYHIGLKKEIIPTLFADRGGIGGHKRNNQNNVISVMNPETSEIGFYKIDGTKVSDTKFDEYVDGFSEDLAPVYGDFSDKTGMIDINGNLVYDYIFDSMTLPYDGKSIVSYNGKFGILKLR